VLGYPAARHVGKVVGLELGIHGVAMARYCGRGGWLMELVNESKRLAEASGSFDRGIEVREREEGSGLVMWRNL
jgi:hypothetical protein